MLVCSEVEKLEEFLKETICFLDEFSKIDEQLQVLIAKADNSVSEFIDKKGENITAQELSDRRIKNIKIIKYYIPYLLENKIEFINIKCFLDFDIFNKVFLSTLIQVDKDYFNDISYKFFKLINSSFQKV